MMDLEDRIKRLEALHPECAEQDAEQWVYLDENTRIRPDGSEPQHCSHAANGPTVWAPAGVFQWVAAYRKGRGVKEAEDAALRVLVEEHEELKAKLQARVAELEAQGRLVAHRMQSVQRSLDRGTDVGCALNCPSHRCSTRPWHCEVAARALSKADPEAAE